MWSEARANLHLALIKGEITAEDAGIMHDRLNECSVERKDPPKLGRHAWEIAEEFGWADMPRGGCLAGTRWLKADSDP